MVDIENIERIKNWYEQMINNETVREKVDNFLYDLCEMYRNNKIEVNDEIVIETLFVLVSDHVKLSEYVRSLYPDIDLSDEIISQMFSVFFNNYYEIIRKKLMDCYIQ